MKALIVCAASEVDKPDADAYADAEGSDRGMMHGVELYTSIG